MNHSLDSLVGLIPGPAQQAVPLGHDMQVLLPVICFPRVKRVVAYPFAGER